MGKKSPDMAEINRYSPEELKRKFKTTCAAAERSISDILIDLVEDWIAEQETQNNPPARKGKEAEDDSERMIPMRQLSGHSIPCCGTVP